MEETRNEKISDTLLLGEGYAKLAELHEVRSAPTISYKGKKLVGFHTYEEIVKFITDADIELPE